MQSDFETARDGQNRKPDLTRSRTLGRGGVSNRSRVGSPRGWMACIVCAANGSAAAQAGDVSTIYGRINVAVESADLRSGAEARMSRLSNYRSVVGFRGTEDLGDGLKALWQLEGALSLDTGFGSFTNRDTRVGLSGPWGTAFVGVWTLPYTSATSSFDPFYPTTAGYMGLMGNGSAPTSDNVIDNSAFDRRQRNVIQYWSPQLGGLSTRVAYAFNEEAVAATGARPSLLSLSLTAESGGWLVTAAHEIHNQYHAANGSDTASKLGLAYSAGTVRLAGVWSTSGTRPSVASSRAMPLTSRRPGGWEPAPCRPGMPRRSTATGRRPRRWASSPRATRPVRRSGRWEANTP